MLPDLTESVVSAQLVVPEAEFHGGFYSLFLIPVLLGL